MRAILAAVGAGDGAGDGEESHRRCKSMSVRSPQRAERCVGLKQRVARPQHVLHRRSEGARRERPSVLGVPLAAGGATLRRLVRREEEHVAARRVPPSVTFAAAEAAATRWD